MEIYKIKSEAEYIADLALGIMSGRKRAEIPQYLLDEIYRKLENIADTLDEYHDFGDDD